MRDRFELHSGISRDDSPFYSSWVLVLFVVSDEVVPGTLLQVVRGLLSIPDGFWERVSLPQTVSDHWSQFLLGFVNVVLIDTVQPEVS